MVKHKRQQGGNWDRFPLLVCVRDFATTRSILQPNDIPIITDARIKELLQQPMGVLSLNEGQTTLSEFFRIGDAIFSVKSMGQAAEEEVKKALKGEYERLMNTIPNTVAVMSEVATGHFLVHNESDQREMMNAFTTSARNNVSQTGQANWDSWSILGEKYAREVLQQEGYQDELKKVFDVRSNIGTAGSSSIFSKIPNPVWDELSFRIKNSATNQQDVVTNFVQQVRTYLERDPVRITQELKGVSSDTLTTALRLCETSDATAYISSFISWPLISLNDIPFGSSGDWAQFTALRFFHLLDYKRTSSYRKLGDLRMNPEANQLVHRLFVEPFLSIMDGVGLDDLTLDSPVERWNGIASNPAVFWYAKGVEKNGVISPVGVRVGHVDNLHNYLHYLFVEISSGNLYSFFGWVQFLYFLGFDVHMSLYHLTEDIERKLVNYQKSHPESSELVQGGLDRIISYRNRIQTFWDCWRNTITTRFELAPPVGQENNPAWKLGYLEFGSQSATSEEQQQESRQQQGGKRNRDKSKTPAELKLTKISGYIMLHAPGMVKGKPRYWDQTMKESELRTVGDVRTGLSVPVSSSELASVGIEAKTEEKTNKDLKRALERFVEDVSRSRNRNVQDVRDLDVFKAIRRLKDERDEERRRELLEEIKEDEEEIRNTIQDISNNRTRDRISNRYDDVREELYRMRLTGGKRRRNRDERNRNHQRDDSKHRQQAFVVSPAILGREVNASSELWLEQFRSNPASGPSFSVDSLQTDAFQWWTTRDVVDHDGDLLPFSLGGAGETPDGIGVFDCGSSFLRLANLYALIEKRASHAFWTTVTQKLLVSIPWQTMESMLRSWEACNQSTLEKSRENHMKQLAANRVGYMKAGVQSIQLANRGNSSVKAKIAAQSYRINLFQEDLMVQALGTFLVILNASGACGVGAPSLMISDLEKLDQATLEKMKADELTLRGAHPEHFGTFERTFIGILAERAAQFGIGLPTGAPGGPGVAAPPLYITKEQNKIITSNDFWVAFSNYFPKNTRIYFPISAETRKPSETVMTGDYVLDYLTVGELMSAPGAGQYISKRGIRWDLLTRAALLRPVKTPKDLEKLLQSGYLVVAGDQATLGNIRLWKRTSLGMLIRYMEARMRETAEEEQQVYTPTNFRRAWFEWLVNSRAYEILFNAPFTQKNSAMKRALVQACENLVGSDFSKCGLVWSRDYILKAMEELRAIPNFQYLIGTQRYPPRKTKAAKILNTRKNLIKTSPGALEKFRK